MDAPKVNVHEYHYNMYEYDYNVIHQGSKYVKSPSLHEILRMNDNR